MKRDKEKEKTNIELIANVYPILLYEWFLVLTLGDMTLSYSRLLALTMLLEGTFAYYKTG